MQKQPTKRDQSTGHQSTGHRIFVLTFWLEEQNELQNPDAWRFRLEEPRSGMRRGCVGIQKIVELLSEEIHEKGEHSD